MILFLFLDILYTAEHRYDKTFNMLFVSDGNCSLKIKISKIYLFGYEIKKKKYNSFPSNLFNSENLNWRYSRLNVHDN